MLFTKKLYSAALSNVFIFPLFSLSTECRIARPAHIVEKNAPVANVFVLTKRWVIQNTLRSEPLSSNELHWH